MSVILAKTLSGNTLPKCLSAAQLWPACDLTNPPLYLISWMLTQSGDSTVEQSNNYFRRSQAPGAFHSTTTGGDIEL